MVTTSSVVFHFPFLIQYNRSHYHNIARFTESTSDFRANFLPVIDYFLERESSRWVEDWAVGQLICAWLGKDEDVFLLDKLDLVL